MSDPRPQGPPEAPALSPGTLDRLSASLHALRLLGAPEGDAEPPERTFGRFRLLGVLGRGKFGVVFLADDPQSGRQVALKVPQPDVLLDPLLRERFSRDAEAAAGLDHPGIVPIHEAGAVGPVPYLVMTYVPGPSLADWLAQQPAPPPVARAIDLVIALADAAQHAHERGVLHCDLKPANVLLGPRDGAAPGGGLDAYQPRVADFGLARLLYRDPHETRTHLTAGTPPYMAPEQALGERRDLTARCDVHALAAILYELLTGVPPYHAPTDGERLRRLLAPESQPDPPRALRREVSASLEAVVLKGLEKAPEQRYASARELADDLRRFREGRPTRARPPGTAGRAALWARRHPLSVALLFSALAMAGLAARLLYADVRHRGELALAARDAELHQFHALLERVRQRRAERPDGWADDNLADLRRLAASPAAGGYQPELCSEAAEALAAPRLRLVRELAPGTNAYALAFSPDGRTVALGERHPHEDLHGELRVWLADVQTGRVARELRYPVDATWEKERAKGNRSDGARSLAYSPDGQWLVLGTRSGRLVRWRLDERFPRPVTWVATYDNSPGGHVDQEMRSLQFSEDGAVLLSCSTAGDVRGWGAREGWRPRFMAHGHLPVGNPPPAPGWPLIHNTAGADGLVRIDLDRNQADFGSSPLPHHAKLVPFCLSGGGQVAAEGPANGPPLWLLGADSPNSRRPLLSPSAAWESERPRDLAFSAGGHWLLSSLRDRPGVELWDAAGASRAARARLRGGSGRLAAAPDGRHFAVCEEQRALLFEVSPGPARRSAVCLPHPVASFALSDGGLDLATFSSAHAPRPVDGGHRNYDMVTVSRRTAGGYRLQDRLRVPTGPSLAGLALRRGERGAELAVAAADESRRPRLVLSAGGHLETGPLHRVCYGPDGCLWAAERGALLRWDGERLGRANTLTAEDDRAGVGLTALLATPHGVFAGRRDGRLYWFDARGRPRADWAALPGQEVTSLAVRADGAEVLVGGEKGDVARVRLPSGEVRRRAGAAHRDAVTGVAYLPDGATLTASADHTIRLWDSQDRPLLAVREGGPIVQAVLAGGELFVLVKGEWGVRHWGLLALQAEICGLGLAPGFAAPEGAPAPEGLKDANGLVAEVFDDSKFQWLVHRRIDRWVKNNWDTGRASPWAKADHFSVRWTGYLQAPRAGAWDLRLNVDDHAQCWVGGQLVLGRQANNTELRPSATVVLPAEPTPFRLDFVELTGHARCRLEWRPAGTKQPFVPVPPTAFFPDRAAAFPPANPR